MKTIYTGGSFDILHPGHVFLLKQCKALGKVVVSLNTDKFIESYKGIPPVMNYKEREALLVSSQYVDRIIPNTGGADSKIAILQVKPDIVAIGIDCAVKDYYKQMQFTPEWLEEHNITLIYLPHKERLSSTKIKERVKNER